MPSQSQTVAPARRAAANRLRPAKLAATDPKTGKIAPAKAAESGKKGVRYDAKPVKSATGVRRVKLRAADLSGRTIVREDPVILPRSAARRNFTTIDLFCGAGGITEGFKRAGFEYLYANGINEWAIETFRANHPTTLAASQPIEEVDAAKLRRELGIAKGELDVLVGGPPFQRFPINAPERFLEDPRNRTRSTVCGQ